MPLALALLLIISFAVNSYGEKFVLTPVADSAIVEWLPSNNMGKTARLRVGGQPRGIARGFVKFDLSAIASTSRVVYARANFHIFHPPSEEPNGGRSIGGLKLFRMLTAWNEGTGSGQFGAAETGTGMTWQAAGGAASPWGEPGGMYMIDWFYLESAYSGVSLTEGELVNFATRTVNEDVQKWVSNLETNHGWLIYNAAETSMSCCLAGENGQALSYRTFTAVEVASREDLQHQPTLVIGTGNPEAPIVLINGEFSAAPEVEIDAPGVLDLQTLFPDGRIFYTLDGSRPTLAAERYAHPIALNGGEIVRAIAYSSNYSAGGVERGPLMVRALPEFELAFASSSGGDAHFLISVDGEPPFAQARGSTLIASNRLVSITAIPSEGFRFVSWSGDVSRTEPTLVFPMKGPTNVNAIFERIPPLGPALTYRRVDSDFFVLQYTAETKYGYRIQESSNLTSWRDVETHSNRNGIVDVILRINAPRMFYRLAQHPAGAIPPY